MGLELSYPEILRVSEVATMLRAAPRTVQLWAECGKLHAFKVGRGWRFRLADVRAFLTAQIEKDPE
jgi:excisionase family DNA binding protein